MALVLQPRVGCELYHADISVRLLDLLHLHESLHIEVRSELPLHVGLHHRVDLCVRSQEGLALGTLGGGSAETWGACGLLQVLNTVLLSMFNIEA